MNLLNKFNKDNFKNTTEINEFLIPFISFELLNIVNTTCSPTDQTSYFGK